MERDHSFIASSRKSRVESGSPRQVGNAGPSRKRIQGRSHRLTRTAPSSRKNDAIESEERRHRHRVGRTAPSSGRNSAIESASNRKRSVRPESAASNRKYGVKPEAQRRVEWFEEKTCRKNSLRQAQQCTTSRENSLYTALRRTIGIWRSTNVTVVSWR